MTQVAPWLFGEFDPALLECSRNAVQGWDGEQLVPSFVAPYFIYAGGPRYEASGDLYSAAAWQSSILPGIVIVLVIGGSLLLALWQSHRDRELVERELLSPVSGPVPPQVPVEEVPRA